MTRSSSPIVEQLALAPLLPIALAVTGGLVADHFWSPSLAISLIVAACGFAGGICLRRDPTAAPVLLQALGWSGVAAAYHHDYLNRVPANDIATFASSELRFVRLRGLLDEEPMSRPRPVRDPFVSLERPEMSVAVIDVRSIQADVDWQPAAGRLRLTVEGKLHDLHVGDEVEAFGPLTLPRPPQNPGEWDRAEWLRMESIRAEMHVRKTGATVVRLNEGWRGSFFGWLAYVRGQGQRALQENLAPARAPLASALLLGEGAPMATADWDRYVRTGVIHVLAISGQQLVMLGAVVWFILRMLGVRRRWVALIVAGGLVVYALLTGGRPAAMRAAAMVGAVSGAILLRQRSTSANTFAMAWLAVLALNPTDLFTAGFQLSFLAVAVIIWGMPRWFPSPKPDELERLIDEGRSHFVRCLRFAARKIFEYYRLTLILTLALAPLVMYWQNIASPIGLLIGPPVIFFGGIALVAGFLLLLAEAIGGFLSWPFAWLTDKSLSICDGFVEFGDGVPGGSWYVGSIPEWWLVVYYGLGIVCLMAPQITSMRDDANRVIAGFLRIRQRAPQLLAAWTCLGLLSGANRAPTDEFRVTFVSVGHGSCTVLELPDGRCFLYDAGSLAGPDVTRRQIAPFLWSRGVRRIDDLIVSHADLDHFNGLPGLLERFPIGQITVSPSFADKSAPGIVELLRRLERKGIPVRVTRAGDRISGGDVSLDVLHPPGQGPEGPENVRSVVIMVRHLGHALLLTGDLEKDGMEIFVHLPKQPVDVMMAPHHGSLTTSPARILDWGKPRLAVSSQTAPRWPAGKDDPYEKARVPLWRTSEHGAITIRSHRTGLIAETFVTNQRVVLRTGSGDAR